MKIFVICGLGVEDGKNCLLEIYFFFVGFGQPRDLRFKTNILNDLNQIPYIFATVSLDFLRKDVDSVSV
jgi:hypothetical protein